MSNTVLLTGASGFIGRAIARRLADSEYHFVPLVRTAVDGLPPNTKVIGNIDEDTNFGNILRNVNVIVHAAARAHVMKDETSDPLNEYRRVNVEGTRNLASQAAAEGVKRFIFISSVKVCGESTTGLAPYNEEMPPLPEDPYGQSKYEAEEVLKKVAALTGMEIVIIRPPLVYGPGVKANFFSLLKLCATSIPLPFGFINNRRSMVYLGNLVDFIVRCIDHPNAANQTFLVSDGQDVSLSSIITQIRGSFGRSRRLVPVPIGLFRLVGRLTGKMLVVDRLVGDLQVDIRKAKDLLSWEAPHTFEQGIAKTVEDFNSRK